AILIWSHIRVEHSPAERLAALGVLTEVDRELGACGGLYLERAALAENLGRLDDAATDRQRADATPPASAWEHVALGAAHARRGDHMAARVEFERAPSLDPRSFWARIHLGRADLALDRPEDALLEFAVCIGLDPSSPLGHLHKALAHARLGQRSQA